MKDKYPVGLPRGLPSYKKMVDDLVRNGDKREKYEKMGKAFAYDNWIKTKQGRKWGKEFEDEILYIPASVAPVNTPEADVPTKTTTHDIVKLIPFRRGDIMKHDPKYGAYEGRKGNYKQRDQEKMEVKQALRDLARKRKDPKVRITRGGGVRTAPRDVGIKELKEEISDYQKKKDRTKAERKKRDQARKDNIEEMKKDLKQKK